MHHHSVSDFCRALPLRCPSGEGRLSVTAFLVYLCLIFLRRQVGDICLALVLVIQAEVVASGVGGSAPLKPTGRRAHGTGKGAEAA